MLKDNLLILRNLHGYSQETVSEKIGISRQAYSKWESGTTIPDIEKCKCLADLYGTTIDSLINTSTISETEIIPPPPKGKNIWGSVIVNERGQIVIPKAVREMFALNSGKRLIVLTDENEGIALVPADKFELKMKKVIESASVNLD